MTNAALRFEMGTIVSVLRKTDRAAIDHASICDVY